MHGTTADALRLIENQGLETRIGKGLFGQGVYLAETSAKSHGYTGQYKC